MRFALLLALAAVVSAADVQPLAPGQDLPYCRVVLNMASSIDQATPKPVAVDGWWSPNTHQLFPLQVQRGDLTNEYTVDPDRIVSVTPAAAQPGRMPAEWRQSVNAYLGKHHPKLPEPTTTNGKGAATSAAASPTKL